MGLCMCMRKGYSEELVSLEFSSRRARESQLGLYLSCTKFKMGGELRERFFIFILFYFIFFSSFLGKIGWFCSSMVC